MNSRIEEMTEDIEMLNMELNYLTTKICGLNAEKYRIDDTIQEDSVRREIIEIQLHQAKSQLNSELYNNANQTATHKLYKGEL